MALVVLHLIRSQLGLQFSSEAFDDSDAVTALVETLRSVLADSAIVDGHDVQSGEVNIFIHTHDPADSFGRCKYVLHASDHLEFLTAAFWELHSQTYTVIWPERSTKPFVIT